MNDFLKTFLGGDRRLKPAEWAIDCAIALAAFAFSCAQVVLSSSLMTPDELFRQLLGLPATTSPLAAYVALALTTLPLAVRRKFSWPVFVFVMIVFCGTQEVLRGNSFAIVGPVIAVFTLACERTRAEGVVAAAIAVVGMLFMRLPVESAGLSELMRIQDVACVAAAAFAGIAMKTHREYVAETEQRALAAEKSREDEAARRVEEERVRIAREIHDITAHSLSAVSIQAAAAERLVARNPKAAEEAIHTVRVISKDALDEIRSMIGVLRSGEAHAETAPTAGTDRMPDLVAYLEGMGVAVDYDDARYPRGHVPAYIDVALFGIAREAATNIARHAHARHASIHLAADGGFARLSVEDDGLGAAAAGGGSAGGGHGIEGMRERVSLLDGTLVAKPRTGGAGFSVRVSIPLAENGEQGSMEKERLWQKS